MGPRITPITADGFAAGDNPLSTTGAAGEDEDEGARRRCRSKAKMKEQDDYEGARRR